MNTTATSLASNAENNVEEVRKQNKAVSYFWFRFREMRVMLIINSLLALISYPLLAIAAAIITRSDPEEGMMALFGLGTLLLVPPFAVFGTTLMTYISGLMSFNYMHNSNIRDMHLALPLTHRQRFFATILAGGSVAVLPYVASCLLGLGIFRVFTHRETLEEILSLMVGSAGETITIGTAITDFVLPVMVTGLMVLLFTFAIVTFGNMICGKFMTAGFFPLLYSALVPLLIVSLSSLALYNAWGIGDVGNFPYVISSPLGMLFGSFGLVLGHQTFPMVEPIFLIPTLVIIAGLFVGSFFLSKYVKAENIGRDFLYKKTYLVQQALVCLTIIAIHGWLYVALLPYLPVIAVAVFTSFVVFLGGHLIHSRGLGDVKKGAATYGIMVGSALLLCVGLVAGGGFGATGSVPAASEVKAVRIIVDGPNNTDLMIDSQFPFAARTMPNTMIFHYEKHYDDEQWETVVKEARRLHRIFIDNPCTQRGKRDGEWWINNYSFEIEYLLANGTTVARLYEYTPDGVEVLVENGLLLPRPNFSNDFSTDDIPDFSDWTTDEFMEWLNQMMGEGALEF